MRLGLWRGNKMRTIFTFVKFFEKQEYADDFIHGNLYMNTVSYFQKDEDNTSVYDKYESVSHHYQPNKIELKFNEIVIPQNELDGAVIIQTKDFDNFNIFCLYAVNSGNFQELNDENYEEFINSLRIHKKNNEFGDFCIVVTNITEFLERVKQAVRKNNFFMKGNFIDYYDVNNFSGSFSGIDAIFHKQIEFSYQNEYRIVINNMIDDNQPYYLEIGDISDICAISSIDAINSAEWNFKR